MSICPTCNQPTTEVAQWRGLMVTQEPAEVFWHGIKQRRPSRLLHAMLFALARRGHVSPGALEMLTAAVTSNSVAANMVYLRRWLVKSGVPVVVRHDGVDYRLGDASL